MGEIKIAKCYSCGYTSNELYLGGGMLNFQENIAVPVYNHKTKKLTTANELQEKIKENPNISFYYDDENLSKFHEEITIEHGDPVRSETLHNAELFLCPKCNKFMLRFVWVGMWD